MDVIVFPVRSSAPGTRGGNKYENYMCARPGFCSFPEFYKYTGFVVVNVLECFEKRPKQPVGFCPRPNGDAINI